MIKQMKKMLSTITALLIIFACFSNAQATPSLQLGIQGGSYVDSSTTLSNGDVFKLYAYLIEDKYNKIADTYFISAALTPKGTPGGDYGSFMFNGSTVNVTADMVFGNPPLDTFYPDLSGHGIYDTYYKEISFQFNSANNGPIGNVADLAEGIKPGYFAAFDINTSLLDPGYEIHFDLYNENIKTNGSGCTLFAPYSHDAESHGTVPEPASFFLVGTGLLGLIGLRRKNVGATRSTKFAKK